MEKDFDSWNTRKKVTDAHGTRMLYRARDIWWCAVGLNIGFEENGKGENFERPVLILKGLGAGACIVMPITSSKQDHIFRPSVGLINGVESRVVLSQIKSIDTKRLLRKIAVLDQELFETIRKSAKDML